MTTAVSDGSRQPLAAAPAILLDIEGTTSSISFVYDQMFPFVRRELDRFLSENWSTPPLQDACAQIARDAGHADLPTWRAARSELSAQQLVASEVRRLMDLDVKATGLKQLQGLIWQDGFHSGELQAHIYDDVSECLQRWFQRGRDVRIYSSGSVQAQKLFFAHTTSGNLLSCFRGHYDTKIGSKRETASYLAIARDFGRPPSEILFLSDVPAELDAAAAASLRTCLVCRPGNPPVPAECQHPRIHSFRELE